MLAFAYKLQKGCHHDMSISPPATELRQKKLLCLCSSGVCGVVSEHRIAWSEQLISALDVWILTSPMTKPCKSFVFMIFGIKLTEFLEWNGILI